MEKTDKKIQIKLKAKNTISVIDPVLETRVDVKIGPYATTFANCPDFQGSTINLFNLFDYSGLTRTIAEILLRDWTPKEAQNLLHIRKWKQTKTAKIVGKKLYPHWMQALENIDANVLQAHKKVFSVNRGKRNGAIFWPELYQNKCLVGDVTQYRAAAALIANIDEWHDLALLKKIENSETTRAFFKLLEQHDYVFHGNIRRKGSGEVSKDEILESFSDWKAFFSPVEKSYRALNATLMNLPGGIPSSLLENLSCIRLTRPVKDRLELLVILYYAWALGQSQCQEDKNYENRLKRVKRIFLHAKREKIKKSIEMLGEHLRQRLSNRRAEDVKRFVVFLLDYPYQHKGDIAGLTRKSIRWHREELENERRKQLNQLGADRETKQPPIPIPEDPAIKFLSSVGEIVDEGRSMNHCVANCASRAVSGSMFLFHYQRNGEGATAAVDNHGNILQVAGPGNTVNGTAKEAEKALSRWAKKFPKGGAKVEPIGSSNDGDDLMDVPF